ncbi:MvdC/MvdD family ATP grasp protein [Sphaerisporangium perillae]|uniref:MvdC/MvdD family ATP grasp protein n=1 Tax=Sphaerisporangium perillae TaxID=2935860 RepID=UPI00200D65E4|nr:ATP-dependent carboxylate-amine ligase [Sphaerisporangium perillae]
MILILSERLDDTVDLVLPKLRRRNVPVTWWDSGDFPARSRLTAAFSAGGHRITLHTEDGPLDLSTVTAVWRRRPTRSAASANVSEPTHRAHVDWQAQFLLDGAWDLIPARWLPSRREPERQAHNKIIHMARAASLGFSVPETVFTNDPAELVPAYERAEGRLIAKQINSDSFTVDGADHRTYTTVLTRRHLTSRHLLRHEPVILQPYVPKAVELRVIVVAEKVFAAEIDSQASRTAREDWRHYDDDRVRYAAHELPGDVRRRCAELVASFGLTYGAIDLILTPEGEYVFLEINPNGAWGFVETRTGLPISDAIADWLAQGESDE